MKKKNIIGHMAAPRESVGGRIRKMELLPRLVCLLLAIVIWLAVVQLTSSSEKDGEPAAQTEQNGEVLAE